MSVNSPTVRTAGSKVGADYRQLLAAELMRRRSRNSLYSIRAFAKGLGLSKTTLADVLAGRRHLSRRNAEHVAARLSLSPAELQQMLDQIRPASRPRTEFLTLEEDRFSLIADWYHYGILSLAETRDNFADAAAVARRLGIPTGIAHQAIERLVRLGYLEIHGDRMVRTTTGLTTSNDVPSAALRRHHHQNLQLAEASLENDPVDRRDISSITMAVDPRRLPEAKALVRQFRRKVCELLEGGESREVYTLSVQLFPLTKGGRDDARH